MKALLHNLGFALVLSLLSVLGLSGVHAAKGDLISNGGFESGSTSWSANTLAGTSAAGILQGSYPNTQVNPNSTWYAYVGDRTTANYSSTGSLFQVLKLDKHCRIRQNQRLINETRFFEQNSPKWDAIENQRSKNSGRSMMPRSG